MDRRRRMPDRNALPPPYAAGPGRAPMPAYRRTLITGGILLATPVVASLVVFILVEAFAPANNPGVGYLLLSFLCFGAMMVVVGLVFLVIGVIGMAKANAAARPR